MSKAKATKNIDAMLSSDESSEEVKPKAKVAAKAPVKKPVTKDSDDESSSEVELLKNKTKRAAEVAKKPAAKVTKKADSDSDESSEEVKPKAKVVAKAPAKKVASDSDESSEDVKPKAKVVAKAPAKKVASDSDDESSEEVKPKAKVAAKKADSDSEDESEETPKVVAKPAAKTSAPTSDCAELFCKNLSWNTDENMLGEFFSKYGEVSNVKVLYDKMTGKARGLAFVAFNSRDQAQAALDDAANLTIDGRTLQVSFSDQKPERPQGNQSFGGNNRDFGGNNRDFGGNNRREFTPRSDFQGERHTAFVGNLGFKTNEGSVRKFFSDCGNVVDVRIAKNEEGRSKGFCHVDFESADAVQSAMKKAGQELDGREIRVDASTPRQGGGNRGGRGGSFGGGRGGRGGFGGRGGRGGFGGNPMDRAKKSGAIISNPGAVMTFDDDE